MSQNHAIQQTVRQFGRRKTVPEKALNSPRQLNVPRRTAGSRPGRRTNSCGRGATERVLWFDYAKGICIILVVMMHSTLGVGKAFGGDGFMHLIVAFAKPFRMPDFFMLSGLFLSLAIGRSWAHYLDKKLVHFGYFYLLWFVIQATIKTSATVGLGAGIMLRQLLDSLINPYPTLWFIYVLPLFFIVTKLARYVPGWLMLAAAAVLQTVPVHSGWNAIDHFAVHYYVFFLSGYLLAPHVFALAAWAGNNIAKAAAGIAAWAVLNGILAFSPSPLDGWPTLASLPVVSIALGGIGATAIVVIASLLQKFDVVRFIRYCGRNSIVLYISFTIPMAMTRVILLKTQLISDIGLASVVVWVVAVISPLIVHLVLHRTPLRFLYERPAWIGLPYQQPGLSDGGKSRRAPRRISKITATSA